MPSLHPEELDALIDRYLTGDLDAATAEQVRAYLDATPGRRGVMAGVRAAIRGETVGGHPKDASAARDALFARLDAAAFPLHHSDDTEGGRSPLGPQEGWPRRASGGVVPRTLRRIVSTVFDRLTGSAMAALFGRKVTPLTTTEIQRLQVN